MNMIRWGIVCALCILYGLAAAFLIGLGVLAIIDNFSSDESLQALTRASVGLGLIGAGSFALISRLLAFIGNAVADKQGE